MTLVVRNLLHKCLGRAKKDRIKKGVRREGWEEEIGAMLDRRLRETSACLTLAIEAPAPCWNCFLNGEEID
jgi:hypothetical protein